MGTAQECPEPSSETVTVSGSIQDCQSGPKNITIWDPTRRGKINPGDPSSIPCGPQLGKVGPQMGPKWAPDGPDWGPFGNAAWGDRIHVDPFM